MDSDDRIILPRCAACSSVHAHDTITLGDDDDALAATSTLLQFVDGVPPAADDLRAAMDAAPQLHVQFLLTVREKREFKEEQRRKLFAARGSPICSAQSFVRLTLDNQMPFVYQR